MTPIMNRTTSLLSLTLLMTAVWSEEVAPIPAPAVDPAPVVDPVPAPAVAPVVAPAAAVESAPAASEVTKEATPAPAAAKSDDVVFANPNRRNRPASAPITKRFSFGVNLGAGYDSNILLENTDTPTATNAKGSALSGELRGNVRLVDSPRGRLGAFASAELDAYPGNAKANLMRFGGGLTVGKSMGGFDPGLVVGYNRFFIDHELAASALNVNAFVAKVFESNVAVLGLGSQYVEYANNDPISGTLYDVSYRHWLLLEPNRITRRIEFGLKVAKNRTHDADQGYRTITPSVGALYRFGDKPEAGTQDVSGRLQYEMRTYPELSAGGSGEKQKLISLTAGYDYWFANWISGGAYAGLSKRTSTDEDNRYDRKQVGLRVSASW